jgi:hypothetical protein
MMAPARDDGRSVRLPHRMLRGALGALLIVSFTACSEQLSGSIGCPQLCGDQSATLRDTTLTGVVFLDTAFAGFPLFGGARDFTLITQGDSADVRLVTRFDTLPNTFRDPDATVDSAIVRVDSARLVFMVDTTIGRPTSPITIDAFDVDTTADDSLRLALLPLFRADRLIGSATYQPADIRDTLKLPIDNAVVLAKSTSGKRLRVGLRLRQAAGASRLRIAASEFAPRVTFRVSPDTAVDPDTVRLTSFTPANDATLAAVYAFYPIVAAGALPIPGSGLLAVGGVAGARVLMRFAIPEVLVDSVQVIRASLLLQQVTSRVAASRADSVTINIDPVVAGPQITDPFVLAQFSGSGGAIGLNEVRLVPQNAGLQSIELVNLFRVWRGVGSANSVRAIVISAVPEASSAAELNFVSMEGAAALRPRLRLTYVPRRGFGLP